MYRRAVLYRASKWVAPAGHDPVTETSAPPQPAMHVPMATDLTARAPTLAVGSGDADGSARAVVSGDARALVFVADCALPSRPVRFVGWWISPPASNLPLARDGGVIDLSRLGDGAIGQ